MVKDLVKPHDWLAKIDLKDAYFLVPMDPNHYQFLQFQWKGVTYQFQCLPFGLSCAPRTFTKLMKPVVGFLRERGVQLIIYLDDLLIFGDCWKTLVSQLVLIKDLFQALGLIINEKKSQLEPSQQIIYLGLAISTTAMQVSLPKEKLARIQQEARLLQTKTTVSVQKLGHDNSSKTGSSDGTIIPSTSPSSDKHSSIISHISRGSETELPPDGRDFGRSQGGADVVGAGSPEIQWCTTAGCTTKYGDRVGCFPTRLGSNVKRPGTENRWPMVSQRARDAHQLPGVVSSFSGNPSSCQGEEWHQYSGQNRQHLGQGLHKSLWGNTFMANECSDCQDVEVVHRSSNLSDGRISSGSRESSGRHGVTDSQGSLRLDASSSSFFTDREEDGPTRGGYVCILADTPAPSLLQLEAGSGFRGNRCLYTELESVLWVCQSPMVSHISNIGKDSTGESLGDLGGGNVEDTTMVSPPPLATVWLPSLDFNTGECSDFTNQGGVHHASGSASVGRLAIIRQ